MAPAAAAPASVSSAAGTSAARAAADPVAAGVAKASLVGFNAGNIISDATFTNSGTMTEAQIQTFFNSKVARCLTGRDENNEPIVCLKDFRMSTVTRPADAYCDGYSGAANESAARIIYRVAQACDINPQVLIVMLQKEQGLITHTWPSAWRYRIALGQGCPDTAPCDPNYIGFFHQIYGAARQMQIYMEGKWFQWYAPGKTWNILYNPNASCGSSPVRIANKATSALYYYTPYQPNAAALRAGYGKGDGCSAYGNRNFYNYFTDWFGPTQPAPAAVKPVLTSVNTSDYTVGVDADGKVWGYPFKKSVWGDRLQIGSVGAGLRALHGLGDLDGDGNRDYVAVSATNLISILRGTGKAGLTAGTEVSPAGADIVLTAAAGDFSGDGVPDFFSTNAAGQLFLWQGDDRGGFRAPKVIGSGWSEMNMLIGGVDMNGDGATDVVGRDKSGRLRLFLGSGTGGWKSTLQIGSGWSAFTRIFSPGDFNGDGRSDLLAETATGVLSLYPGSGGGYLGAGSKVGSGWNNLTGTGSSGAAVTKPRALMPGVGDLDRTQGRDVVAITATGALVAYGGNGTGGWAASRTLGQGWTGTGALVPLGDFNGDGLPDLGRVNAAKELVMYPGNGAGGYGAAVTIGRGWGDFAWLVGGMDFDGDRKPDVIGRTSDGRLLLYRGDGRGSWASNGIQIGKGWSEFDTALHAGDFNGDGRGDMIARRGDGTLWLYPTDGAGTWLDGVQIGKGWAGMRNLLSPGDFDGNGTMDVLTRDQSGAMWLYRGDAKGGFTGSSAIGRGWSGMTAIG